ADVGRDDLVELPDEILASVDRGGLVDRKRPLARHGRPPVHAERLVKLPATGPFPPETWAQPLVEGSLAFTLRAPAAGVAFRPTTHASAVLQERVVRRRRQGYAAHTKVSGPP